VLTKKNAKLGQRGHVGVTLSTFGILGPFDISGVVEARNFKFGTKMDGVSTNEKKYKITSKLVMWG